MAEENSLRGLGTVRVSKEYLLKRLVVNREKHRETYEVALSSWQQKAIATIKSELRKVQKDINHVPFFSVAKPSNHLDSYDTIIELLEASLDEEFELSRGEFNQYIRDEWGWSSNFYATVSGCSLPIISD